MTYLARKLEILDTQNYASVPAFQVEGEMQKRTFSAQQSDITPTTVESSQDDEEMVSQEQQFS